MDEILMEFNKSDTSDFSDFYEDRKIFFDKEVTPSFVQDTIMWLMRWECEDLGVAIEERQPITIFLNSNGGSVQAGLTLIDFIQCMETPISMVVLSKAFSMTAWLLLAIPVERRYMFKNSTILFHDGYFSLEGKSSWVKDHIKLNDVMDEVCEKLVLENTKITKRLYNKKIETEWFMLKDEAKKLGVVGNIIGEDISLQEIL